MTLVLDATPGSGHRPPPPPVEVLGWPSQSERLEVLRREGRPRLLVLDRGVAPPPAPDALEDVIWTPTDERDLFARLNRLASRSARPARLSVGDVVVGEGVAAFAGQEAALPPTEARILARLADPPGRVHRRDALALAAWGDTAHTWRSLDSRLFTLRQRLVPLGLVIGSVRGRGFVLEVEA